MKITLVNILTGPSGNAFVNRLLWYGMEINTFELTQRRGSV